MDQMTAALINAGSSVLGKAVSGQPASSRSDGYASNEIDFSGWTVATGGSNATGAPKSTFPSWMILAGIVVVALAWKSKK